MAIAYISIGTNHGDRERNVNRALIMLKARFDVKLVSSLYDTQPSHVSDAPWYYNAVVKIETLDEPSDLMQKLTFIENAFGRNRLVKYGDTSMDLDILYYDSLILETQQLCIPHYKNIDRRFVLEPLMEIEPEFVDPKSGKSVKEMLLEIDFNKQPIKKIKALVD